MHDDVFWTLGYGGPVAQSRMKAATDLEGAVAMIGWRALASEPK